MIHQISDDNYLVPSAISPDPTLSLDLRQGHFPYKSIPHTESQTLDSINSPYAQPAHKLTVATTGLVYRRMLHLPPIASGFWSKFISLCIQHEEIILTLSKGTSDCNAHVTTNRLQGMVSNVGIEWQYWKTGIMLIADDKLIVRVNSLRRDVFNDPKHQSVISSTLLKVRHFKYREAAQWVSIPEHLSEVIEIIVPVTFLAESGMNSFKLEPARNLVSAKLMAKMLELIDEILKSHCEHLAMNGIYTVNDMLHLTPCPLCYGDEDCRVLLPPAPQHKQEEQEEGNDGGNDGGMNRRALTSRREVRNRPDRAFSKSLPAMEGLEQVEQTQDNLYTFRVDECIQQTLISDSMRCPRHGELEIAHLAPDIVSIDFRRPTPESVSIVSRIRRIIKNMHLTSLWNNTNVWLCYIFHM